MRARSAPAGGGSGVLDHEDRGARAGVLRVRTSRRPSEPDPVSTGDRESQMKHVRVRAALTASARLRGGADARRLQPHRGRREPPASRRASASAGRAARRHRRPRHPRVLPPAQEAGQGVRGGDRLRPRGPRRRRRRHAGHQAQPHRRQPDRRRRLRHRQHLRLPPARRGRLRRRHPVGGPAAEYALAEGGDRLVPIDSASVCVNVDTAWFEQRGHRPAADPGRPHRPGVRRPPGDAGRLDEQPRAWPSSSPPSRSTATTGRPTGPTCSPTAPRSSTAGRTPTTATSPPAPKTAPARSSCPTTPRRPSPSPTGRPPPRRCSTPASARSSTPACSPGADNPAGAEALIDWMLSDEVQSALPESMYVFPVMPGATVPDDWAEFAPQPTDPYEVDPDEIDANREQWLTEWTDVISR